jgi:HEAT repeat protein
VPLVKKPLAAAKPKTADDGMPQALARLNSVNAQDRWEAARHLADFPGAVAELSRHLGEEQDPHVREAVLTSLARINNGNSFDAILRYLRADDASLRTAALDALKLMPDAAGSRLDALLRDPDVDVRVLACDLARIAPAAIARQSLSSILATEPDINVCAAAIDLLAEIGTPEMLPRLAQCAARFAAPFLNFSVQIATDQISARSAPPR